MAFKLKNIPYVSYLKFTDQLMRSLVMQAEETIDQEIKKFVENGTEIIEIEISAEEGIYQYLEYYCGLTDQDVILDDIFTDYFPSLIRRSVFQTIYGVYEVELQALCRSYQEKLGGKKFDNYAGSGIVKVHNYIKNNFPKLSHMQEWDLLDQFRILRNNCVNNNGRVFKGENEIKLIAKLIEANPSFFHHDGLKTTVAQDKYTNGNQKRTGKFIIFENGSLKFVVEGFEKYVEAINREYTARQNT
ncbi:hypothetical protein EH243_18420 [Amphritea opalescens]|uniref:Uncharacterized protein n=1 Tax=Amphritea opalescens TaxID=2490544 RepID=A0A430KLG9_9GAMM|nr:hypothetical protein [Amphritea opalescens]RTE64233.1 hypothetical protein EH243_18420 [Amphritea opalescens]